MSENLRDIGDQAAKNYAKQLKVDEWLRDEIEEAPAYNAQELEHAKQEVAEREKLLEEGRGDTLYLESAKVRAEAAQMRIDDQPETLETYRQHVESQLGESALHFTEHEEAYRDLAAIDAHLDGVKLNVDHPLHSQVPEHPQEPSAKV